MHFWHGTDPQKFCLLLIWPCTKFHAFIIKCTIFSHIRPTFIRLLESIISKLATSEFSILYIVYVAGETGLTLALSDLPKTGFVASRPVLFLLSCVSFCLCAFSW